MEIVTGEQMRRIDERAIERFGVPSLKLMEAAGRGIASALLRDFPDLPQRGLLLLCGKGNNGGDGLVAARYLARREIPHALLLLGTAEELSPDARDNLKLALQHGVDVTHVNDEAGWEQQKRRLEGNQIVLDAMLGTGIKGGARGLVARVIRDLNMVQRPVVAVDVPSGIDADRTETDGISVKATRTYALCRPKLALVLDPSSRHVGQLTVIPIGIPDDAVEAEGLTLSWTDRRCARRLLPRRAANSHKGDYGHLLAVAGSPGKSGAAVLLARGALRAGAGLVSVASVPGCIEQIAVQQAEIMTEMLAATSGGQLAAVAAQSLSAQLEGKSALAIGPGLGTDAETRLAVRSIVHDCSLPLVIDADGLNALADDGAIGRIPEPRPGRQLILTPHPGEAGRLLDQTTAEVQADRPRAALRLAERSGAMVVLKGHQTLVAAPDGRLAVNSSGNPGMATAGTGDVLTGIAGAFLARGMPAWDAARLAAFVHGSAGDMAAATVGFDSLIASDLIAHLPQAMLDACSGGTQS
jgi:hydroxyethylthiazole kinase-like uncharacterized protein yjeF